MKQSNGSARKWWIALAVVLGLALLGGPVLADDGPGTRFLECRSTAHGNYNTCLVRAFGEADRYACDFAWGMDLIACDIELVGGTFGALFNWWKN